MRARRLIPVALVAAVAVLLAAPAAADDRGPSGQTTGYIDSAGNPTAEATQTASNAGSGSSNGGAANSPPPCRWVYTSAGYGGVSELVYEVRLGDGTVIQSPTGRWVMRQCDGLPSDLIVYPEGAAMPELLAEHALRSIAIPEPPIATSPPADRHVVQVPSWLWVDGGWWTTYSASATAGLVTATVTAQPTQARWSMGDGSTVTCGGPGVPWAPGLPEGATDCAHTYTSASSTQPGGTYPLEVAVEFSVTWTSNIGASGALGPTSRSTGQSVQVGEIQAIETK
jgi:hypothetical protein